MRLALIATTVMLTSIASDLPAWAATPELVVGTNPNGFGYDINVFTLPSGPSANISLQIDSYTTENHRTCAIVPVASGAIVLTLLRNVTSSGPIVNQLVTYVPVGATKPSDLQQSVTLSSSTSKPLAALPCSMHPDGGNNVAIEAGAYPFIFVYNPLTHAFTDTIPSTSLFAAEAAHR